MEATIVVPLIIKLPTKPQDICSLDIVISHWISAIHLFFKEDSITWLISLDMMEDYLSETAINIIKIRTLIIMNIKVNPY